MMNRILLPAFIVVGFIILYTNLYPIAEEKDRFYYEEKGYVLWDVKTQEKVVALTFDDGPHPEYTAQILDILDRFDAKATFFVLGQHAEKYPELIRREFEEGHEIANHTYTHGQFITIKQLEKELIKTNEILYGITGVYPSLFRPVGGNYNERLINAAIAQDFKVIMWSWHQDTEDWKQPGVNKIVKKVLHGAKPGDVILFHDAGGNRSQTVEALLEILPELKKQGYEFVTISELLNKNEAEVSAGEENK